MALINCPECGHAVSDKADSCPNCGYKLAKPSAADAVYGCGYILTILVTVPIVLCVLAMFEGL